MGNDIETRPTIRTNVTSNVDFKLVSNDDKPVPIRIRYVVAVHTHCQHLTEV